MAGYWEGALKKTRWELGEQRRAAAAALAESREAAALSMEGGEEEEEEDECTVCLNVIESDDASNPAGPPLPCGHRCHAFCLDFCRSITTRNTSCDMPAFSGPPSIPSRNATKPRRLRSFAFILVLPPVTGTSCTCGKGCPSATRPCRYDGATAFLLMKARRQALTRSEAFSASFWAMGYCSRRAMAACLGLG